ncbi:hypothetical protein [Jeotgalibacillus haloalkalitolerans]|uniref:30S ribosomal protein S21 n=1 Tax=Jeotgalibacillus haloalkalitolerans TaxID=3104292 RepID=A0ABU5KNE9_9BACL|nr:hypothetical protein [Jeotgalibacillus sp. HH7-29]MDZ5712789.1 hypothetical protein [Jeotgalibacillus sp. HH7-29]
MKIVKREGETVEELLDRMKKQTKKDKKLHNFYEKKCKKKGGK